MRKRLFGRHGAITLFLCLLLSAVILLESIYVAGAYRRKQEVILTEAVSHQVEQILSQFDRNTLNWYGVYGMTQVESGSSVFEKMTEGIADVGYSYELTDELGLSDILASVSEYMRLRGIAFEGADLLSRLNASIAQLSGTDKLNGVGVAAWLPTFKAYLENRKKYSPVMSVVEKVCDATGLSEKLSDFFDFADDLSEVWARNSSAALEIGDSSVMVSVFDPSCISSLTKAFDVYMDADFPDMADRLLLNEYAVYSFDSFVKSYETDSGMKEETNILGIPFSDIHGDNRGDLEYLLIGNSRPAVNSHESFGLLLGIRLILNMSAYMLDESKKEMALGIAEVLSILITLLSAGTIIVEPTILQYVVLFVMAYIRAFRDGLRLLSGGSVPVFYNDTVTGTLDDLAETSYRDYYRIFLLFVPEEKLLERMKLVIFKDCGYLFTGVSATGRIRGSDYTVRRRYELYENHE